MVRGMLLVLLVYGDGEVECGVHGCAPWALLLQLKGRSRKAAATACRQLLGGVGPVVDAAECRVAALVVRVLQQCMLCVQAEAWSRAVLLLRRRDVCPLGLSERRVRSRSLCVCVCVCARARVCVHTCMREIGRAHV